MTIVTENQAVIPVHRWRGIASSVIGVTSIIFYLLLVVGIAIGGTEPLRHMITALQVLSSALLFANLIGIALGFFGAKDRSSKKLYPLLGLTLNIAIVMTLVALAVFTLAVTPPPR